MNCELTRATQNARIIGRWTLLKEAVNSSMDSTAWMTKGLRQLKGLMKIRSFARDVCVVRACTILLALSAAPAFGQAFATVSGNVTDPSRAEVPVAFFAASRVCT